MPGAVVSAVHPDVQALMAKMEVRLGLEFLDCRAHRAAGKNLAHDAPPSVGKKTGLSSSILSASSASHDTISAKAERPFCSAISRDGHSILHLVGHLRDMRAGHDLDG